MMARPNTSQSAWGRKGCPRSAGFSLPELLVVMGLIALLMAILLPPLQVARRHAMATRCGVQLQQIGVALDTARDEYGYYPLWDDGGSPVRYTWIDVLLQRRFLGDRRVAYCPEDALPEPINAARGRQFNVYYPGNPAQPGMDYSYGIAVPLSAGGWNWSPSISADPLPRRFLDAERYTAQRALVADANWSYFYNFSGDAYVGADWSYPSQFDNMVSWRHNALSANVLYQDNHVSRVRYDVAAGEPLNTSRTCVWYPGEPVHVNPASQFAGNYYPDSPPLNLSDFSGSFPRDLVPGYYTMHLLWTQIEHK